MTKDATIREIHHRVKNNLQSVAALLRLQARRMPDEHARGALEEAVRRVGTIALVHDTLSHGLDETVDFDEVADLAVTAVIEVATHEGPIHAERVGSFGRVRAEDATSLAMVVSELVQNAAEHGVGRSGGTIRVCARRSVDKDGQDLLSVSVTDNGTGLPSGKLPKAKGLGSQIVQSLVADLRGKISWGSAEPTGTTGALHRSLTLRANGIRGTLSCYPARRARALRRFRERRSSSESPPQTPASCPDSRAHFKHVSITSQRRHTALACSICRIAGPVLPIGKKSSGSSSRQAARSRQSMGIVLLRRVRARRCVLKWAAARAPVRRPTGSRRCEATSHLAGGTCLKQRIARVACSIVGHVTSVG